MATTMTAEQMIQQSVAQGETVIAPWVAETAYDLDLASKREGDSVHDEDRDVAEYWGTTEDGDEWRVHLTGAAKAARAVVRDLVRQDRECDACAVDDRVRTGRTKSLNSDRSPSQQIAGWLSASGEAGDGGVVAAIELLGKREAARVYAAARGE